MSSLYDQLQYEERLHDRGKCVDGCIYCKKKNPALQPSQPGPESVQITAANSEDRIEEAISVILHCWDDWDADAQQEAQQAQSPAGWLDVMEEQLRVVLQGMVFDQDRRATNE